MQYNIILPNQVGTYKVSVRKLVKSYLHPKIWYWKKIDYHYVDYTPGYLKQCMSPLAAYTLWEKLVKIYKKYIKRDKT